MAIPYAGLSRGQAFPALAGPVGEALVTVIILAPVLPLPPGLLAFGAGSVTGLPRWPG